MIFRIVWINATENRSPNAKLKQEFLDGSEIMAERLKSLLDRLCELGASLGVQGRPTMKEAFDGALGSDRTVNSAGAELRFSRKPTDYVSLTATTLVVAFVAISLWVNS